MPRTSIFSLENNIKGNLNFKTTNIHIKKYMQLNNYNIEAKKIHINNSFYIQKNKDNNLK